MSLLITQESLGANGANIGALGQRVINTQALRPSRISSSIESVKRLAKFLADTEVSAKEKILTNPFAADNTEALFTLVGGKEISQIGNIRDAIRALIISTPATSFSRNNDANRNVVRQEHLSNCRKLSATALQRAYKYYQENKDNLWSMSDAEKWQGLSNAAFGHEDPAKVATNYPTEVRTPIRLGILNFIEDMHKIRSVCKEIGIPDPAEIKEHFCQGKFKVKAVKLTNSQINLLTGVSINKEGWMHVSPIGFTLYLPKEEADKLYSTDKIAAYNYRGFAILAGVAESLRGKINVVSITSAGVPASDEILKQVTVHEDSHSMFFSYFREQLEPFSFGNLSYQAIHGKYKDFASELENHARVANQFYKFRMNVARDEAVAYYLGESHPLDTLTYEQLGLKNIDPTLQDIRVRLWERKDLSAQQKSQIYSIYARTVRHTYQQVGCMLTSLNLELAKTSADDKQQVVFDFLFRPDRSKASGPVDPDRKAENANHQVLCQDYANGIKLILASRKITVAISRNVLQANDASPKLKNIFQDLAKTAPIASEKLLKKLQTICDIDSEQGITEALNNKTKRDQIFTTIYDAISEIYSRSRLLPDASKIKSFVELAELSQDTQFCTKENLCYQNSLLEMALEEAQISATKLSPTDARNIIRILESELSVSLKYASVIIPQTNPKDTVQKSASDTAKELQDEINKRKKFIWDLSTLIYHAMEDPENSFEALSPNFSTVMQSLHDQSNLDLKDKEQAKKLIELMPFRNVAWDKVNPDLLKRFESPDDIDTLITVTEKTNSYLFRHQALAQLKIIIDKCTNPKDLIKILKGVEYVFRPGDVESPAFPILTLLADIKSNIYAKLS